MVELIKLFGPPKFWSSFYNEGFIGRLKPYFQHINYMNTEMQVFSKYLTTIFFEIVARKQGVSEFIYKRYEIIYKQICTVLNIKLLYTDRNNIPHGTVNFDFSPYSSILMEVDNLCFTFGTEEGISIESISNIFMYDNRKKSRSRINHHKLHANRYISININLLIHDSHVGIFKAVLTNSSDGTKMLAYVKPVQEEINTDLTFMPRTIISNSFSDVLYLVPLYYFDKSLNIFPFRNDLCSIVIDY